MMRGPLMEITKRSGEFVWLAILDEASQRFWVYDFDTKKFHMNKWLTVDYEIDRELEYAGIDKRRAVEIVTTYDRKIDRSVRAEHKADLGAVPASEVLGDDGVPDARSVTRLKAQSVAGSKPGTWVTWKIYSYNQAQTARVAASDLRNGKIKTVTKIAGPVDARVVQHDDGDIEVQVSHARQAAAS